MKDNRRHYLWENRIFDIKAKMNSGLCQELIRRDGHIDMKLFLDTHGILPRIRGPYGIGRWYDQGRSLNAEEWWEIGVWNPAYIYGLICSKGLKREGCQYKGKRYLRWAVKDPSLNDDILAIDTSSSVKQFRHTLTPNIKPNGTGYRRFDCLGFLDGSGLWGKPEVIEHYSCLAGLLAGGVLGVDKRASLNAPEVTPEVTPEGTWIWLPNTPEVRTILKWWTIPFTVVKRNGYREGALRVSAFYGVLVVGHMSPSLGIRMMLVKEGGGCPLLSWVYWEWLEGSGGSGGATCLPFNSSTEYYYKYAPDREDLHRIGVGLGVTSLNKKLEWLMRRWISSWRDSVEDVKLRNPVRVVEDDGSSIDVTGQGGGVTECQEDRVKYRAGGEWDDLWRKPGVFGRMYL